MPCLLGCLALFFPRLVIILVWVFGTFLQTAYQNVHWIWPVLGFIFLPLTTLAYAAAWHMGNGTIGGLGVVLIVIAVIIDLGMLGGGASHKEVRKYYIVNRN